MYKQSLIIIAGCLMLSSCKKEVEITFNTATGIESVSTYSAKLSVVAETSADVDYEWGIAYGLTPNPKDEMIISSNQYGKALNYQVELTNLTPNTTYYAQPWYADDEVHFIDDVISFKTDTAFVPGEAKICGLVNLVYDVSIGAIPEADQILDYNSGQNFSSATWVYNGSMGPFGAIDNQEYSIEIDLNTGVYTATIVTEGYGANAVNVDFGVYDFVGTRVTNNNANTADSTILGTYSMGGLIYSTPLFAGDSIYQDFTLDFTPL